MKNLLFLLVFFVTRIASGAMNIDSSWFIISDVTLTGTWTFSTWYYCIAQGVEQVMISDNVTTGTNVRIGCLTGTQKINIRVVALGSADGTLDMPTPNYGAWHFLVVTRNSADKVDVYIDGRGANRIFADAAQTGNTVFASIGRSSAAPALWGRYWFDDLRIYNRTLDTNEINSLYNSRSRLLITDGLVGWYKMDEGIVGATFTDGFILDSSISKNNGSIFGGIVGAKSTMVNYP